MNETVEMVLRLVLAGLLGGLIGFERENWTITLPADPPRVSPGEAPIMRYLTMWTGEEGRG